jgi:hypothetical protein
VSLAALAASLRDSRGVAHKRDLDAVVATLAGASAFAAGVPVGDDCAAIPDGDGYLLFAIEGFLNEFIAADPWFAGYCAVMVNAADIAAMGGRPIAVVDALWSAGTERAATVLEGMAAASRVYGVPIVGGHSNARADREQLSAAIIGRATRLLTSFDARPGDRLLAAIDLRGRYREPYPYWDASTGAPSDRLRADLALLPAIAEAGACSAAKDISMAGVVGTAMMLLECSGCGGVIDVDAVPRPADAPLQRWLTSFPSFGFILAVPPGQTTPVIARFAARGIACADVGHVDDSGRVRIAAVGDEALVWDFDAGPLIGCGPRLAPVA